MRFNLKGMAALVAVVAVAQSQATVLMTENFNYNDGSLTAVSGALWVNHSGTAGQMDVQSGQVNMTETESEDVNRSFGVVASGSLFAGADVTFSGLPSGTGGYFMHFKDAGTSNFRARVFAVKGVGTNTVRIGITNSSNTVTAIIGTDLNLGTKYRVVLGTDAATQTNSNVEVVGIGSVTASDSVTAISLSTIALRQSLSGGNGMGTMKLDNLKVATTRVEVVPEPATYAAFALGSMLFIRSRRKR